MNTAKENDRCFALDALEEYYLLQCMGDSIEAAVSRARQSSDYIENAKEAMRDEVALQNIENEAIYKQGFVDCLVQLFGINTVKVIMHLSD